MRIETERDIDALRSAAELHAVLAAWSGAGLFQTLADGKPRRPDELAVDARAVRIMAAVLVQAGVLCTDGERLALSETALQLHEGGALRLGSAEQALGDLSRLDAVLAQGGPVRAEDGTERVTEVGVIPSDPEAARAFMDHLYRRSEASSAEVVRWLAPWLEPGAQVLDLGGGHGRYARDLVRAGFRATLFDLEVCVELAREKHGETLEYRTGDFLHDDLGGPYDAVLLSNIVHGLGAGVNVQLVRRVARALAPKGVTLFKDMFFLDELGGGPEKPAQFGLRMLMYTREGKSYSLPELRRMCSEAGLEVTSHVYVPDGACSLVLARHAPAGPAGGGGRSS
jgi:2-polyprenyl-3-methyl-5-hydroxy-6-metoxy-1,4-benzoquinol methylase